MRPTSQIRCGRPSGDLVSLANDLPGMSARYGYRGARLAKYIYIGYAEIRRIAQIQLSETGMATSVGREGVRAAMAC